MTNTTYVDMDGVIADFKSWISQFGTYTEADWKNSTLGNNPWEIMDKNFATCYLDLAPLDLLPKFNELYNLGNVKFLTALPSMWYNTNKWQIAKDNKTKWLLTHISNFRMNDIIVTNGARDKIQYCIPGDTLYDDRLDTINLWNSTGGNGIHIVGKRLINL